MITMDEIIQLNARGLSVKEIAQTCDGITADAVYKRLYRRGFAVNEKRSCFNTRFFHKIDSATKAYWLGFIFADGCVLRRQYSYQKVTALRIGLCIGDKTHLEKFLYDIRSSNRIAICNGGTEARISLNSDELVTDLERHGCVQRKSLVLGSLPKIESGLIRHFIRGYFDGDGCVCYDKKGTCRLSLIGTEDFLLSIRMHLLEHYIFFTLPRQQGKAKYFVLAGNGNSKAKLFYAYLYRHCRRYLKRKKEMFHAIL